MTAPSRQRDCDADFSFVRSLEPRTYAALEQLVSGIQDAAERDGTMSALEAALAQGVVAEGVRAFIMRAVFMLMTEARGFFDDQPAYARELGLTALVHWLRGRSDEQLNTQCGAYRRCVALWRAMHFGAQSPGMRISRGGGDFFNPESFPFLEGRLPGSPLSVVPSVRDVYLHNVAELLSYDNSGTGKLIDWATFDPYYLGFIYEGILGFEVIRLKHDAVQI